MSLVFLDAVIVLALFSAIVGGFRLGLIARATSWVGLVAGAIIAVNGLPWILRQAGSSSPQSRLSVVIFVVLLGALLGQILGLFAGSRLSAAVPEGKLRSVDRGAGSVAGVAGVLISMWLMLPAAANVPGWPARQVRSSVLAQEFYDLAPAAPNTMDTLRRLVGSSAFPSVFEGIAPTPDSGPPPSSVSLPAPILESVRSSTVKVEGTACRRNQDGSGFAIGPNLIVTNAHVVAGENKTTVLTPSGSVLTASVVLFDAGRDLAILRVPRYTGAPLPLSDAKIGETGAVFGHPRGQDEVAVLPATVSSRITAVGPDLYGVVKKVHRDVLLLSASVQPGDSGGALVNNRGEVIGVVFALAPDKPDTAYALSTLELRAVMSKPTTDSVSTGPCLSE